MRGVGRILALVTFTNLHTSVQLVYVIKTYKPCLSIVAHLWTNINSSLLASLLYDTV